MIYHNIEKFLLTRSYFAVTPDGIANKNVFAWNSEVRLEWMRRRLIFS
jgi:hypothetical protein